MKRAFFIVGPESSGTRFVNRSFISAGCIHKYAWQFNENDGKHNFNGGPDIVFHRSIPHQNVIPDLKMLRLAMENCGFNVIPLLVIRDWNCTVRSQLYREIAKDKDDAEKRIRKAITHVTKELTDFMIITYEAFCLTKFRNWLIMDKFGLDKPTEIVYFQNPKYYDEDE